jgi:hypothetical protein
MREFCGKRLSGVLNQAVRRGLADAALKFRLNTVVTHVGEAIDLSDDQVHSSFALAMMVDDDPEPQPTQQGHKEALQRSRSRQNTS